MATSQLSALGWKVVPKVGGGLRLIRNSLAELMLACQEQTQPINICYAVLKVGVGSDPAV
jgi:hypothetical protein